MKYIIMCGGTYPNWQKPRQMTEVDGEPLVARTMRLLREHGVTDISISSNDEVFEQFGVPVLKHANDYTSYEHNKDDGLWCNAFYPTDEPTCYLFGDVLFSPSAIQTICDTPTDSVMLFGSKAPFSQYYPKPYREPFAFKVEDTGLLKWAIKETKRLDGIGAFRNRPISWEFWSVVCGTDPNKINNSYVAINDYTCDIDDISDINKVVVR